MPGPSSFCFLRAAPTSRAQDTKPHLKSGLIPVRNALRLGREDTAIRVEPLIGKMPFVAFGVP
jgi:hypothetical protein